MRINALSLMSLILLVIFTVAMGLLTKVKDGQVRAYIDGDPERRDFKTTAKLRDEVTQLQGKIRSAAEGAAARQREIERLDQQLSLYQVYFSGSKPVSMVSIPGVDAAGDKTKSSPWKQVSDRVAIGAKRIQGGNGESAARAAFDVQPIEDTVRARQQELQAVAKRIAEDDARFTADRDELTKRLDAIASERDKAERVQRDENSRRATKVAQLEDDIRKLLELELKWIDELDSNGLVAEIAANQVVIGIGSADKVVPGLLFSVFSHDKGRYVTKGMIEVIETRERISVCRILRQDEPRLRPIGRGDSVGNPLFSTGRPKTVYVAGGFKRYNNDDIERFVRATGATVLPVLGPDCEILIAGERSDREQARARQFQIQAMNEETLLRFVQPQFRPQAAAPVR